MSEAKQKVPFSSKILIVGGILGVGLFGLYLYRRSLVIAPTLVKPLHSVNLEEQEEGEEKDFARVVNSIKRQINAQNKLSSETIKTIYKSQIYLSRAQFKALTTKSREERRKHMNDLVRFSELVAAYEEDVTNLHNKHLEAVLEHFKYDKNQWMEAVNELSISGTGSWDTFLFDTEVEQFQFLRKKTKSKMSIQLLEAIFRFKTSKLKQNQATFMQVSNLQKSQLYTLIQSWIQDSVFMIFKAEIQDINFSMKQLNEIQQMQLDQYQHEYGDLLQLLVLQGQEIDHKIDFR